MTVGDHNLCSVKTLHNSRTRADFRNSTRVRPCFDNISQLKRAIAHDDDAAY